MICNHNVIGNLVLGRLNNPVPIRVHVESPAVYLLNVF
jgi:hypothetical protein